MTAKASTSTAAVDRRPTDPMMRAADAALRRAAIKAQERARALAATEQADDVDVRKEMELARAWLVKPAK